MYEMYEGNNTYVEGGLTGNTEDYEGPAMATGLGREVPTPELNDNYVNKSVMLPKENSYARGKIIGQKRDADGNYVGRINDNPILDTREYRVEFDGGEVIKLTANVIKEFMYAAYDDSGNYYLMMDSIVDYQKSNKALSVSSQRLVHRGRGFMWRSTMGWHLLFQWIDGSTLWQALKDLKESHQVEIV